MRRNSHLPAFYPRRAAPGAGSQLHQLHRQSARKRRRRNASDLSGGCPRIERCATAEHGKSFAELEGGQQDDLLTALQDGVADAWSAADLPSSDFFEMLRVHTLLGFLADPSYGGNREYAGWKWVGYPGPRHSEGGYSPAQMIGKAPIRAIWEKR